MGLDDEAAQERARRCGLLGNLVPSMLGAGPSLRSPPALPPRPDCLSFPAELCAHAHWHTLAQDACPHSPSDVLILSSCSGQPWQAQRPALPWSPQGPHRGGWVGSDSSRCEVGLGVTGEPRAILPSVHSGLPLHGQGQASEEGVQLCGLLQGHARGFRLGPETIVLGTHEGLQQPPGT